ncbi:hypothetical protein LSTR_LSTR000315 [Laodelphax striatellus]|uniref:DNA excision repair protein ERCC-1 n=1 Tax=Laodelphax striatellus TaxID=195883 RepID=A0A482X8E3_LAOST|nr:hypothetical protein LSTR_LSTR000315 [Laodelphax striatellus]
MEDRPSSSFSAHFSKLKKSDRYESIEEAAARAEEEHFGLVIPSTENVSIPSRNAGLPTAGESSTDKPTAKASSANCVLVSPKQKGNPLLKSITNVPWQFEESLVPDYVMGRTTCALFLSLRYHTLKPDYIAERLKLLGKMYDLRVLLVQVDQKDPHHSLKHLTRICLLADLTLMLAWSAEEAGRIIENYKIFEHKPADALMARKESGPRQKLVKALTTVHSVNKTDASTLFTTFKSLKKIIRSSEAALSLCPGFGSLKASRLYKVIHQPFLKAKRADKPRTVLEKFVNRTATK